jgi:HTH-type transcriptional repressor of NAD biosynthesis genes
VAEYGRITSEYAGGEDFMIAEDLYENILRQRIHIMDAAKVSNRLLFVDTDAVTTLFYARFLLRDPKQMETCEKMASSVNAMTDWDLVLFLEPDVPFVQDGTRNEEIARQRGKYSQEIKALFDRYHIPCETVEGDYLQRFDTAKEIIAEKFRLTTQW